MKACDTLTCLVPDTNKLVDENLSLLFVESAVKSETSFLTSRLLNTNIVSSPLAVVVSNSSAMIVAALAPALNAPVFASTDAPAFSANANWLDKFLIVKSWNGALTFEAL